MSSPHTKSTSWTTSSRLDRQRSPQGNEQEQAAAELAITYCENALGRSTFFTALRRHEIQPQVMAYAFGQYGFFRLQLHTWFAVCLMKADNAADPAQRSAIMALADHIFTDLKDNHDLMFGELLTQLGFEAGRLHSDRPSTATLTYMRSFADDFASDRYDLFTALAALSGRELIVALRNRCLLNHYFDNLSEPPPVWLALHAEVELDHFLDALRPVLLRYSEDPSALVRVHGAIAHTIDRHIDYFDELYRECAPLPPGEAP